MCGCTGLIDPTDSPAAFPVRPRRSLPADRLPGKAMRHSIQTGWRLPALCAIPHLPVSLSVSCPSNAGQTDMCSPSGPPVDPVNFPSSYHSLVEQCEGRPSGRPPQRDPIFRDAKVLLFWCDQQQKEYWFYSSLVLFLFAATSDGCFTRARGWSLAPARPLYHLPVWCPGGVISNVRKDQSAVAVRVTVTAMKVTEAFDQLTAFTALFTTLTETVYS